ncbi:Bug family tripartite tricarboxylate transporter substrate binding protein [Plastoroseomonas hellenica]|uniref:Tripartite tricarboxylate transporter substrate binding protein n=1 Tax=Plastoroseomonas hellenica TaxID=2687306 RepID=A0ABS5F9Z2_9PROT|nr:tripartite tricarboxylate transporter substrate binding protein [Plastoroseomonas hellenica]MBR0647837.1 tripartite tricarboxylate transporter substrate binding protein [Plastoroseomonas hellenica]MBR0669370.1 tripartite tricarboxylate transporter substrate binding protein [Plastoroseomonas hellenica]
MITPAAAHPSRRALLGGGVALGLARPHLALAQAWPTRPVTLVVGFPPGGQTDFAARVIQQGMSAALGQPVVIDNRGGAGGNIGTEAVLRARPDGYTLLAANSSSIAINPHTFPGMTINPLELVPIGLALQSPLVLCLHPSVPARDIAGLTAWIRAQRGGMDYGTAAAGSMSHCAMELFRIRIGNPEMQSIPYRGSGPAMQDFIAGRFSALFDATSVVAPFVRAGQVRGLLVTGEQRSPAFPDIPTGAELGVRDFVIAAWIGLSAPRGTPPEIVQRINAAMNAALSDPAVRERITSQGDEPGGGTAAEFDALVKRDHARWGEVARAANIRADG